MFPETKIAEYQNLARSYHEAMHRENGAESTDSTLTVQITPYSKEGSMTLAGSIPSKKIIYLHPLFLIDRDDLPRSLRDSTLQNYPHSLDILRQFLSDKFQIPEKKLTNLQNLFKRQITMWDAQDRTKEMNQFSLAHEVAHIYLCETGFHGKKKSLPNKFKCISILVASTVAFSFTYFQELSLRTISLTCIAACISAVANEIFYESLRISLLLAQRKRENDADLKALQITNNFAAAKFFFEGVEQLRTEQRKSLNFLQKCKTIFCTGTEYVFPVSHPTPKERIEYLTQHFLEQD